MNFATNLHAQFQRITALHPQLLDAVPPAAVEDRNGTFSLNVSKFWEEFCSRDWQPRAGHDKNLIGPFRMYGECLAPAVQPGELHYYDPTLPAQDGDIVLVQWHPDVLQDMYARHTGDFQWLDQYGEPCPIATKVYKTVGTAQYLLTRKSALPLGRNRILGVLRKRLRDESCGAEAPAHCIELEAATALIIATSASFTTPLAGLEHNIATISAPALTTDYTAILTASCERWVTGGAGAPALFIAYPIPLPAIVTLTGTYTNTTETTSPGARITLSGQLVVPAGTAQDFYFRSIKGAGVQQHECRNINFQLEIIKR